MLMRLKCADSSFGFGDQCTSEHLCVLLVMMISATMSYARISQYHLSTNGYGNAEAFVVLRTKRGQNVYGYCYNSQITSQRPEQQSRPRMPYQRAAAEETS